MAEVLDSNAVELWNAFVKLTNVLSGYEDKGGDVLGAIEALRDIMRYAGTSAYTNKSLIAKWLGEEKVEAKGLEDTIEEKPMGGLVGKLREAIEEQDENILNPTWVIPPEKPMIDDKDYPYETI